MKHSGVEVSLARSLRYSGGHDQPTLLRRISSARPADPPARLPRDGAPGPGAEPLIRETDYLARFTAPEFTSICPVTGQPDFGILMIDYVPDLWLVESKSLKLYLGSFRNHGAFHEDCTVGIGMTLVDLLKPRYFRIGGYWNARGGIPSTCSGRPASRRNRFGFRTRDRALSRARLISPCPFRRSSGSSLSIEAASHAGVAS